LLFSHPAPTQVRLREAGAALPEQPSPGGAKARYRAGLQGGRSSPAPRPSASAIAAASRGHGVTPQDTSPLSQFHHRPCCVGAGFLEQHKFCERSALGFP